MVKLTFAFLCLLWCEGWARQEQKGKRSWKPASRRKLNEHRREKGHALQAGKINAGAEQETYEVPDYNLAWTPPAVKMGPGGGNFKQFLEVRKEMGKIKFTGPWKQLLAVYQGADRQKIVWKKTRQVG